MPETRELNVQKRKRTSRVRTRVVRSGSGAFVVVNQIREGIPSSTYTEIVERLGVTKTELARQLRIPSRTIASRRGKRLTPQESEKVLRVTQVFEEAEEVLGSRDEARRWLNSPQRGLDSRKPIEMLDTGIGAGLVRDLLSAIKYGNVL